LQKSLFFLLLFSFILQDINLFLCLLKGQGGTKKVYFCAMNSEQAKQRIEELIEAIEHHNKLYYVDSMPSLSDYDFDMLFKELERLEAEFPAHNYPYSPTKRVGGDITKRFETVAHRTPMLSLTNTYSKEEIIEWINRTNKQIPHSMDYVCELKYDGLAVSLHYQDGILQQALTRGDGERGENVTANVKTIRSIPLKLKGQFPTSLEIRGEIFIPLKTFQTINEQRVELGEIPYANPRNLASGTLKLQDSKMVAQRGLDAYMYAVHSDIEQDDQDDGHYEMLQRVKTWGFKVPESEQNMVKKVHSIEEIMDFIHYWETHRRSLPFDIDGIVIKINSYAHQNMLGLTSTSPRWARAFKFKTQRVETPLLSIDYQVGRTGAITPVANLQAVQLGGTSVKRASLHNFDQFEKWDLHQHDFVWVEKGGEIIPKIVGVNTEKRNSNAQRLSLISHCPACGTALIRAQGEAQHFCPNERGCPPQMTGKIEHFIARKAMNIDGLGSEIVGLLFKKQLVKTPADLYQLTFDELINLDRMGEKSANNLLQNIQKSTQQPFEQVLFALGIRYVGETVAKKLAQTFGSLEKMMQAKQEDFIQVEEIGERIAQSLCAYFANTNNQEELERLKKAGLQFSSKEKGLIEHPAGKLKGKSIVVSGVFQQISREELKKQIEYHGGQTSSSISKKTDFIVAGENMGPAKLKKANDLTIPILSETDFLNLIKSDQERI